MKTFFMEIFWRVFDSLNGVVLKYKHRIVCLFIKERTFVKHDMGHELLYHRGDISDSPAQTEDIVRSTAVGVNDNSSEILEIKKYFNINEIPDNINEIPDNINEIPDNVDEKDFHVNITQIKAHVDDNIARNIESEGVESEDIVLEEKKHVVVDDTEAHVDPREEKNPKHILDD